MKVRAYGIYVQVALLTEISNTKMSAYAPYKALSTRYCVCYRHTETFKITQFIFKFPKKIKIETFQSFRLEMRKRLQP